VQEFSLGREVVFVCGHKRADPDILHEGLQLCASPQRGCRAGSSRVTSSCCATKNRYLG
jgi:hypothetical protein